MTYIKNILFNSHRILLYGCSLAILVFLLKWLQWKFLIADHSLEIYIGLIALFFTMVGIWVATQLNKPRIEKIVIEKEVFIPQSTKFSINQSELDKLNLSDREYEILQLLAKGYSNADIATQLFLSVSTIKTHVSNLYIKMDVKRRTQAIVKAKELKIVK
ncbi:helix-turn-helix transcriptional regulator [Membranihabitans maritimus]|uniref:helix-turn-helix transcriptional regulator n=1 Tax=Membranihabitans maritimus TaxID=2904244 RepID=UPI001F3D4CA0|nr:response regulator transcription factor [Membranihabitans maritimus]